jgi:hypothetical protein
VTFETARRTITGMTRVALHACCGPCLLEPHDELTSGYDVTVVYANPNIHPLAEYRRRRDGLLAYAVERGIGVVEVPYDPRLWLTATSGLEHDQPARCTACFSLRLGLVAALAQEQGMEAIATTLTVSPYQDADVLARLGQEVAREHGLRYVGADWRERYPEATRRSRELGMYRQNYCGCLLSDVEADAARERRRAERRRANG